jgi:hypothetical protein
MRHGLQSWDIMHQYLPWRTRNDLRATLCKIIRKQAISEYQDINADPFQISEDNKQLMANPDAADYKVRNGILVNQRWNRTSKEIAKARAVNIERYDLEDSEALKVEVPLVMSVEYLQGMVRKREMSLRMFRAALLMEKARRAGTQPRDLGLDKGFVLRARHVLTPVPRTSLKYGLDTDKDIFDICEG